MLLCTSLIKSAYCHVLFLTYIIMYTHTLQGETVALATLKSLAHNVMNRSDSDATLMASLQGSSSSDANATINGTTHAGIYYDFHSLAFVFFCVG